MGGRTDGRTNYKKTASLTTDLPITDFQQKLSTCRLYANR